MSAKRDRTQPLGKITFACTRCRVEDKPYTFVVPPGRTEADEEAAHHPWRYYAACPSCGQECEQTGWERALLKAWSNATGPVSAEGKAASAKNLEGHPTPEEARRTRFNAMKHGLNARVATYFPAKPDGYAFCRSCDVDREWCAKQPACVKRAEMFLMHHAAFDQRRPEHLTPIYADMHAALFSVLQQILQTLIAEGVRFQTPVWYSDKDGGFHLAEYIAETGELRQIKEVTAHPLLKPLGELLKSANLSLADMGMTTKVIDQQDELPGQLAPGAAPREELSEFQRRVLGVMDRVGPMVERARQQTSEDPVLLEYNRESGVHEARPPRGTS